MEVGGGEQWHNSRGETGHVGGKWGFIDKNGTLVVQHRFDNTGPMVEGLAPVEIDRKWGYVDPKGNVIIDAQFDEAEPFSEGLAADKKGGKWGHVDKTGRMAIPITYDNAWGFRHGLALVEVGGTTRKQVFIDPVLGALSHTSWAPRGYIEKFGTYIWTPRQ